MPPPTTTHTPWHAAFTIPLHGPQLNPMLDSQPGTEQTLEGLECPGPSLSLLGSSNPSIPLSSLAPPHLVRARYVRRAAFSGGPHSCPI